MSMAITRLKMAHLFVNSKRLTKHVYANETASKKIEENIKELVLKTLPEAIKIGYNEIIKELVKKIIELKKEYYQKAVFGAEQEMILYILRQFDNFEEVIDDLEKDFKEFMRIDEQDSQKQASLKKMLENAKSTEEKIIEGILKEFKLLRDQKRDNRHLRDRLFSLKQNYDLRHSLKEMKRKTKKEQSITKKDEELATKLEKQLKKIKHPEDGSDPKISRLLDKTIDELQTHLLNNEHLIEELMTDAFFVIRYAVNKFFSFEDIEDAFEAALRKGSNDHSLNGETIRQVRDEFKEFQNWLENQERTTYKIMRKFKKEAKHEMH